MGDLINYQGLYSNSWYTAQGSSWSFTDSHGNLDQKRYFYICAPVWEIQALSTYYALWNSGIFQLEAYYWNGAAWVLGGKWESNASDGSSDRWYSHNSVYTGHNAKVDNDYPLWKIVYWPSRNNNNWFINIRVGGFGFCSRYPQGQLIYSCGNSQINYYYAYNRDYSPNNADFPFNPTSRRGQLIYNKAECVSYPYNPHPSNII